MVIESGLLTTPSGVRLGFTDAGSKEAPSLVFLHGIAQSRASFASLFEGPLLRTHRLVAFDLRGHGDSDAPEGDDALRKARLGEDLQAVIAARELVKPTLVAWSYGGVVVGEYLRAFGEAALGGVVLLAASIRTGKEAANLFGAAMMENGRALVSADASIYEAGAKKFLEGSTASPLAPDEFQRSLQQMLRVPAHVRRALLSGGEDYGPEYARLTVPLSTIHGSRDAVVKPEMSLLVKQLNPATQAHVLEGVGHVPWLEAPDAFLQHLVR